VGSLFYDDLCEATWLRLEYGVGVQPLVVRQVQNLGLAFFKNFETLLGNTEVSYEQEVYRSVERRGA
jgi:hypothetical protein